MSPIATPASPPSSLPLLPPTTTTSSKAFMSPIEPSRFIHISGIRTPRPLTELRHWFSRGHFIYDELREPVVPAAVAGAGPDRLATAASEAHPKWEDTLGLSALGPSGSGSGSGSATTLVEAETEVEAEESDAAGGQGSDDDAAAVRAGGARLCEEKPMALKGEPLFEAQLREIESIEAALALAKGEGAVAAEEEKRLNEAEMRKAEIKSKTWSGSRGKYGHKKGARPHAFHGRAIGEGIVGGGGVGNRHYQQNQQQQQHQDALLMPFDGRYGMNPYAGSAHAGYPGQFHPYPTPSTPSYENYMATEAAYQPGPGNTFPGSPNTYYSMRQAYEAKLEAAKQEQHRLRCERLAERPWTWRQTVRDTTPVVSPVMSVLSPRAHEFVPAGLISPHASRSFAAPSMDAIGVHHRHSSHAQENVVWYPAPPAAIGSTQYWLNLQYETMSTLNPAAGEFRPRAMSPRGPKKDDGATKI